MPVTSFLPTATQFAQPAKTTSPPLVQQQPLFGMLAPTTASPPPMNMGVNRPPVYMTPTTAVPQNSMLSSQPVMAPSLVPSKPTTGSTPTATTTAAPPKPASSGNFDDLWSMSLGATSGFSASKPTAAAPAKSMRDLEKEKAQAGIWGAQKPPGGGSNAFGAFGAPANAAPPSSSSGNGGLDDLLF